MVTDKNSMTLSSFFRTFRDLFCFPWLSRPGKWSFKIPRLSRTSGNPGHCASLFVHIHVTLIHEFGLKCLLAICYQSLSNHHHHLKSTVSNFLLTSAANTRLATNILSFLMRWSFLFQNVPKQMFVAINISTILTCVAKTKPVHAKKTQQNRVDQRVDKIMSSISDKQALPVTWHTVTNTNTHLEYRDYTDIYSTLHILATIHGENWCQITGIKWDIFVGWGYSPEFPSIFWHCCCQESYQVRKNPLKDFVLGNNAGKSQEKGWLNKNW